MYIVLEMPQSRLLQVNGEMFLARCAGDSDDAVGSDDLLPAPSYGNCDIELTFEDLWQDDPTEPRAYRLA